MLRLIHIGLIGSSVSSKHSASKEDLNEAGAKPAFLSQITNFKALLIFSTLEVRPEFIYFKNNPLIFMDECNEKIAHSCRHLGCVVGVW